MARTKKNEKAALGLTAEEKLSRALVPMEEQPYEIPENWVWTIVGTIASLFTGNSINEKTKSEKYSGNKKGLIYIATKDIDFEGTVNYETNVVIDDYDNFKIAPRNTALLCIEGGSAGRKVGFVNRDVCFVNKLCAFSTDIINPKYVYYYICSQTFVDQFNSKKHGLIGGVSVSELKTIAIPLPPLAEQTRIVSLIETLFSQLDEARAKAQAVVDGFEDRKAAILHRAFTGELTAKWREENGVDRESWDSCTFSDLCSVVRGGSPRPAGDPRYYDGDIPFLKVADITNNNGPYVVEAKYSIKEAGLKKTRLIDADTLLLTNSGATLGVPAICKFRTTFNDGIAAFLNLPKESLLFYYYFWTSRTQYLRSINMGAAQPNLNTDIIGNIQIEVPPVTEQNEIVRVLDNLLQNEQQVKETAEQVIAQIDVIKKSILARAFRGELGTNDPTDESATELLKQILEQS